MQGGERSRQHISQIQDPHALQRLAGLLFFIVSVAHS